MFSLFTFKALRLVEGDTISTFSHFTPIFILFASTHINIITILTATIRPSFPTILLRKYFYTQSIPWCSIIYSPQIILSIFNITFQMFIFIVSLLMARTMYEGQLFITAFRRLKFHTIKAELYLNL